MRKSAHFYALLVNALLHVACGQELMEENDSVVVSATNHPVEKPQLERAVASADNLEDSVNDDHVIDHKQDEADDDFSPLETSHVSQNSMPTSVDPVGVSFKTSLKLKVKKNPKPVNNVCYITPTNPCTGEWWK